MAGVLWAIAAGFGFGFFQILNRRGGLSMDAYRGTFILLLVSAVVLAGLSIATEDLTRLWAAPWQALAYFSAAGLIHFFVGWTLLSISQQRVGAARTGALVGATPLFAAGIAAVTLGEFLNVPTTIGVMLVVSGVYLVSNG